MGRPKVKLDHSDVDRCLANAEIEQQPQRFRHDSVTELDDNDGLLKPGDGSNGKAVTTGPEHGIAMASLEDRNEPVRAWRNKRDFLRWLGELFGRSA